MSLVRLMAVSSCTGKKSVNVSNPLTLVDLRDPTLKSKRESELARHVRAAGDLYMGEQHVRLMRGVNCLREKYGQAAVSVQIVSAGYGLVSEHQPLAPYEATFKGMGRREAREWAQQLDIPNAVRKAIQGHPLVIFLLGAEYLEAIEPPVHPEPGQRLLFFAPPREVSSLRRPGVTAIPAGREESSLYRAGLVALKGRMFELLAYSLLKEGATLFSDICGDDAPGTVVRALRKALP